MNESLFLIIHGDCVLELTKKLTEEMVQDCKSGFIQVVNISGAQTPMELVNDHFVPIELSNHES
jgi:hypothetical protein